MRTQPAATTAALALVLLLLVAPEALADEPVVLIVHRDRQVTLDRDDVQQIFLRRKRFWDDGELIAPLNLRSGNPLRERFSQLVLRWPATRLTNHWNRQYFDGILPPATLGSTAAVLRFVAAERNAIGYVPATMVDGSVRIVLTLPPP